MLHDSGIVTIYRVSVDENGPPPKVEKLVKRSTHYFGEMTVGIQRLSLIHISEPTRRS